MTVYDFFVVRAERCCCTTTIFTWPSTLLISGFKKASAFLLKDARFLCRDDWVMIYIWIHDTP